MSVIKLSRNEQEVFANYVLDSDEFTRQELITEAVAASGLTRDEALEGFRGLINKEIIEFDAFSQTYKLSPLITGQEFEQHLKDYLVAATL